MQVQDKLRCNARIAAAMLDTLAATGDVAGHNCARKVFAEDRMNLRAPGTWLPRASVERAFAQLGRDRDFARRVGASLVSNERIGFVLFVDGVATIEKAFRRSDHLLAREDPKGRFQALDVQAGFARIAYHPGGEDADAKDLGRSFDESFCGLRQGMLEALPLGFGLLPAHVHETQCVGQGAAHCCFEVRFELTSRRGAQLGLAAGVSLGAGFALVAAASGVVAPGLAAVLACASAALGFTTGRAVDLAKQLQAVAGARRGHLALLEQADQALAEKMDELAKHGVHPPAVGQANTDRLRTILTERGTSDEQGLATHAPLGVGTGEDEHHAQAARQIYQALGPLQRGLDRIQRVQTGLASEDGDPAHGAAQALRECVDASQRLGAIGASLADALRGTGRCHEPVLLSEVVERAIAAVRPVLLPHQTLEVKIEDALARVACEPFQMEQVALHLLRNAAKASGDNGTIHATLRPQPGGVEFEIEDTGCGIPEEVLETVFDPFASEGEAGGDHEMGLATCYRIVTEHGGELRIASDPLDGTCVTVSLPSEASARDTGTTSPQGPAA